MGKKKTELPNKFPFWARLKIGKRRTTSKTSRDNRAYKKA